MHALGNDFIFIDNRSGLIRSEKFRLKNIRRISQMLCDRRFGIGADQLLLLDNSKTADFRMRIFNADGSEVEMCGNGIRCAAKYIWDKKLRTKSKEHPVPTALLRKAKQWGDAGASRSRNRLAIETRAGIMHIQKKGGFFRADMGEPILKPEKIPVRTSSRYPLSGSQLKKSSLFTRHSSTVKNFPLKIDGKIFKITCVSMGNPHTVIVVKDIQTVPLSRYGPAIENHRLFPNRTNVEFIQIRNRKNILMRVWERGAGETMACGTGASAAAVASSLLGLTCRKLTVHLPGGKLVVEWSEKDNHVYMTGPAVEVFEGSIEI